MSVVCVGSVRFAFARKVESPECTGSGRRTVGYKLCSTIVARAMTKRLCIHGKSLPDDIIMLIASFSLNLGEKGRMMFYDEGYDQEPPLDDMFHECKCMMELLCVQINGNFSCFIQTDTLPTVVTRDEIYNTWDQHFVLYVHGMKDGKIVTANNSLEFVPIGRVCKRTLTKCVPVSKVLVAHATFVSDCELEESVCIEEGNENTYARVWMQIKT